MRENMGAYRGRRVDNYQWVYGYYINCFVPGSETETRHYISVYPGKLHEIYVSTLGEYTGRKDKDGKKIYEGDLVEWDGQSMQTYLVIYGDDASFFGVPVNGHYKRESGHSLSLLNAEDGIVVVGNIYE